MTHPGAGNKSSPSIAAVVASKDSYPTLYNAEVRVQKHRQEMIEDLKEMTKELLKKFRQSTKAIPEKILFYRDGVSRGQFQDVLIKELSAIQRACLELQAGWTPAITFIVVQKRHHARFFATDPKDQKGKSRNIPAGKHVLFYDRNLLKETNVKSHVVLFELPNERQGTVQSKLLRLPRLLFRGNWQEPKHKTY